MGVTQTKGTALIDTDEGRRRDRLPVNRERGLLARPYHRLLKLRARSPSDYRTPGSVTKLVNDAERGHSGSERATEDAGRGELSPSGFRLQSRTSNSGNTPSMLRHGTTHRECRGRTDVEAENRTTSGAQLPLNRVIDYVQR
jgi:hypothetical protein